MKNVIALLFACSIFCFGMSDAKAQTTTYHVTIPFGDKDMIRITSEFTLQDSVLHMTPNGPLPERWPEYVRGLHLHNQNGDLLPVIQKGDQWITKAALNQPVKLCYSISLTHTEKDWPGGIDGVAFSTDWGLFLTGRSLFVMNGEKRAKINVQFEIPANYKITTPWSKMESGKHEYEINSYRELTESLIMAGQHKELLISQDDLRLQFALGGEGIIQQEDRIQRLAQKTMDYYLDLMTGLPVISKGGSNKVLVVINESDQVDGEVIGRHISMLLDPQAAPQQQLVGWFMFAHEFFHLWNGKTITVEGTQEDWFKEGITNYYTLKALYQVGFINEQALTGVLNGLFYQRYRADSGLGKMSMRDAASGFDKDNHWGLVYGGGLFAGIALDMTIRENTDNQKSLDDLMRQLYKKYAGKDQTYTTNDILAAVNKLSGRDLTSFFDTYINGTKPIPIEKYLSKAGYSVTIQDGQLLAEPKSNMTPFEQKIHDGFLGE